jgi:hypothetical protein
MTLPSSKTPSKNSFKRKKQKIKREGIKVIHRGTQLGGENGQQPGHNNRASNV